uniref:2-epi-5-epi-valiolone synthase n=1 Tax=Poecilia reticulata TaxID=8081 RepID=A0A3P9NBG4_POERE
WTVVSPIVFTYRVIQCKDLLDRRNDTLLWGHTEHQELKGTTSNSTPVKRFVVIDKTVHELYGSKISQYFYAKGVMYKILPVPTTEENKNMELVTKILEEVHQFGIDIRSELIIALGGGVCFDVVGLAASLYRRRTPYVRMALMKHPVLFELLEVNGRKMLHAKLQPSETWGGSEQEDGAAASVRIAIETMLEELAPNLWEDDLDWLLDFGHIMSPELEMRVLPALLHGEADSIGMSFMVYVAHQKGLLTTQEKSRIIQCMLGVELPVWHQECSLVLVQKSFRERLRHSAGSLRMPLPTGLGRA